VRCKDGREYREEVRVFGEVLGRGWQGGAGAYCELRRRGFGREEGEEAFTWVVGVFVYELSGN
jgi:hypothetical protein